MVNEDGNLELRVTERQVLPGEADRRLSWWTVLLSFPVTLIACATAVLCVVALLNDQADDERQRDESDREISRLSQIVDAQDDALTCRGELNASLQAAVADAGAATNELTIEIAEQFDRVTSRLPVAREQLERRIAEARRALNRQAAQAAVYDRGVTRC